jgi:polyphosphate kinase
MGKRSKKKHAHDHAGGVDAAAKNDAATPQKLKAKDYEREMIKLQTELVKLQEWAKAAGAHIVIIFEGRDAAGKGGIIKRVAERTSPRVFRVIALPAPTDREKTQIYLSTLYCPSSRRRRGRYL